jgi:hypothetical protein
MITNSLKEILTRAYPCPAMCGVCRDSVRYAPERGLIPRGYAGAAGRLDEVRLVLCLAEPGEPAPGEKYDVTGSPDVLMNVIDSCVSAAYRDRASSFHRNVRFVLECCWPGMSFEEQIKRTWITEGVLCSAHATTKPVPQDVEKECAKRYLIPQLAVLSHAFVIALGKKAQRRLELAGRPADAVARAAGRPIGSRATAESSWKSAGLAFQEFQKSQSA